MINPRVLMKFFALFLVALLLGIVQQVRSQPIKYLGIEQGLSNNTITSIYQDRYGFMWFGTFDGLNRYDGYDFTKFRNRIGDVTSLAGNYITAIGEDKERKLWVATMNGAGVLDDKSFKFKRLQYIDSKGKAAILNTPVNALKADSSGNVFLGTVGLGLLCVESGDSEATRVQFKVASGKTSAYTVYSLDVDKNGIVWLLTNHGLFCFNPKTKKDSLLSPEITAGNCIEIAENGDAWIGTNAGLFLFDHRTKKVSLFNVKEFDLSRSRVFNICFDRAEKLWIATDGDGLIVVDICSKKLIQKLKQQDNMSLLSNSIYTVFIDKANRKWIGTLRGGVNIIDPKINRFHTVRHEPYNQQSIIHNTIMSFCEDGDNIWVGTDGGGITVWNRKLNTYKHHVFKTTEKYSYGSNQVTSIIKDTHDDIWIATYGSGVKKYNRRTETFENVPFSGSSNGAKYVWRLYQDADKNIWAGCIKGRWDSKLKSGLYKLDIKENRFITVTYPISAEIISITDDNKGNLWLGSLTGLIKIDKKSSQIKEFNLETYVRVLKFSRDGTLWIGTSGRGLWSLDKNYKKFKSYDEEKGLANNIVVTIEQDSVGDLWLGTFNGLSRLNPQTSKVENFYVSDGLQSNQFYYNASARLNSGEMLFGGIKGFNVFNPASITQYKDFPSIMITGMKVLNNPVNASSEYLNNTNNIYDVKEIRLPYDKSMFSLDFVALEYSLPDKIQYAYYLKGWDKAWNFTKNLHSVSYSRLNEGKYTLEIKSTNASGIWNSKGRFISITVLPPWYRSWWAYCLYLALAASGIYGYVYYQKQQAHLLYEIRLARLKASQEAELNEKKISFFTNISHELRTPLTLIVNPIKDLLNNDGKNINLVDISTVYRNTRRLLSLVDQLLLFKSAENEVSDLKPEILNIIEVCNEVFLCFNNQVKSRGLNYKFNHADNNLAVFADREKIEIILFNLLSNAIKFTPKAGAVSLEVIDYLNEVEILVKDSGPGIPENIGEKLFEKFYRLEQTGTSLSTSGFGIGLFISKVIANKQEGSLTYTSIAGEGTTFKYILPKKPECIISEGGTLEPGFKSAHLLDELIAELPDQIGVFGSTVSESMTQIYDDVVKNKPNVLLIDDDLDLRTYIRQILNDAYTVFEAESAEQGLEMLKTSEPDIIVCDVVMQGMSGVEFCSQIKASKESGYIPVILLTGTSSPEIKLKGIECGADDYITKPFEKDLFLARIKSILKGRDSLKTYFFNEVTLQNNNVKVSEEYSSFLKKCIEIVERHLQEEQFNVRVFVKEMGMSHSNVFRKVKSISGLSISEFIRYLRLKKAAELMIRTDIQVKEVAFRVGLQDLRYFREQFSKLFGLNPSDYIKKYRKTFLRAPGS